MSSTRTTEACGAQERPILLGRSLAELTALVTAAGAPPFRAKQLHHWLYRRGALNFAEMHNLARDFRAWLEAHTEIGHISLATIRESADGTRKLLFRLHDNRTVESVLIRERNWWTLCVSSQVGCAVDCKFCMTGFGGYQRQMTTAEILSQIILAARHANGGEYPRNVVFMGMGEPMLNLDAVLPALRAITDPDGMAIAARRVTVSTAGILPGIERLGEADLGVNIAISLNASNDRTRTEIMPINKVYPLERLLSACRAFPLQRRKRITFEYVLLGGLNDSDSDARALVRLLHGLRCKLNLIPWNPDPHLPFKRPSEDRVRRFQQILLDHHFTVSIRYSKGLDVGGACGQLAGHWAAAQAGA
ncbi:MAG: 23S rRNA (adenine(2503)-C(2))-methyltransferase RlmN [Candidatus Sumerlaeaceae bacterium]|nr:23S rRNA (adenine(2503)-C(2))-methyltransferase RlmN [Candidatus Sumerlaeaceae bacterium]